MTQRFAKLTLSTFTALLLSACATTQYTSGADFNARTLAVANYSGKHSVEPDNKTLTSINHEIAEIAAVEPALVFPARIGIAHIHRGKLTSIPSEHMEAWLPLQKRIETGLGEMVPISPLISAMVNTSESRDTVDSVVNRIRRGAARQHVDYVLIYETHQPKQAVEKNGLSFTDLSVIGLFVLPSRNIDVEASASAILLDVRNGYPYGTASGFATRDGAATSYQAWDKRRSMEAMAEKAAVEALATDVDDMLDQLMEELALEKTAESTLAQPVP